MRQRIGLIAAWLGATVVSVLIASSAVATVQNEVTDSPSPLRESAVERLAVSSTMPGGTASGALTSPPGTSTTAAGTATTSPTRPDRSTTSTSLPATTATTTASSSTATPPTTAAPAATTTTTTSVTTTTTTAAPEVYLESYELAGGVVRIRVEGATVRLEAATPAPGFDVDVGNPGPDEVVVEFESDEEESKFRARVDDGELVIDIDEE